jgi:ATP-dependent RNA helicase SUPV3L1/SUV3
LFANAKAIDDVPGLTLEQRFLYTRAPISDVNNQLLKNLFIYFATAHGGGQKVKIRMPLPTEAPMNINELQTLELKFNALELYIWFSWRFPAEFTDREEATTLKNTAVALINTSLCKYFSVFLSLC